jgi:hypothetical protein
MNPVWSSRTVLKGNSIDGIEFCDDIKSRKSRQKDHEGLADTPPSMFIFIPEGKCSKQQLRQPVHSDDVDLCLAKIPSGRRVASFLP